MLPKRTRDLLTLHPARRGLPRRAEYDTNPRTKYPFWWANEKSLGLQGNRHMQAILVTIPLFLACIFLGVINGFELYGDFHNAPGNWHEYYHELLADKGEGYIDYRVSTDPDTYLQYFNDDELQLSEYLSYRYVRSGEYTNVFVADALTALVTVVGGLFFLIATLRIRRAAPLIFDRENGLVRSWDSGGSYAIAWEDLRIGLHWSGILIFLPRVDDGRDKVMTLRYVLRSQNYSFAMNEERDLWPLLTRLCDYMEGGLAAASLETFENRPVPSLREQVKPPDFVTSSRDIATIRARTRALYGEELMAQ